MLNIEGAVQVRLKLDVGQMAPTPAIASVLGSRGVNIMKFLQEFNQLVKSYDAGCKVIVIAYIFKDKKFKIIIKGRPAADLLKEEAKLQKGSSEPGKVFSGTLTMEQVRKVAEAKIGNVHTRDLDGMVSMLVGTARSMGMRIVD